jgi:hypothetical protein
VCGLCGDFTFVFRFSVSSVSLSSLLRQLISVLLSLFFSSPSLFLPPLSHSHARHARTYALILTQLFSHARTHSHFLVLTSYLRTRSLTHSLTLTHTHTHTNSLTRKQTLCRYYSRQKKQHIQQTENTTHTDTHTHTHQPQLLTGLLFLQSTHKISEEITSWMGG